MVHLIDKDAVVAEIKSYKDNFCDRNGYLEDCETNGLAYDTLCELEDSIDALEVKEVDINKEISQFIDANFEKATIGYKLNLRRVAKHFFELGLKAQKGE